MGKLCAVISCLLLSVAAVTAQGAQSERLLPQWLTGILAVTGFLFLTFVAFLVKKAWCEEPSRKKTTMESVEEKDYVNKNTYDTSLEMRRDNMNVYDSVIDVTVDKATDGDRLLVRRSLQTLSVHQQDLVAPLQAAVHRRCALKHTPASDQPSTF
ncbi:Proximal tubules-expressed gene protein [Liparis tanakae]|uniref:Proximal tubules-expressed gene protein n=1 Tax=Liparis tanakae TaxID=230148 RepID=A0A4Z2HKF1_9TELE|nr:Proximal tubules-expressed gene protein [Liparis tanakae]